MYKSIVIVFLLSLTALGGAQDPHRPVVSFANCEMSVVWCPGQEAVLHIVAESTEDLECLRIFRPDGGRLVDLDARTGVRAGLSHLEIELREPDPETLFAKYAEGAYELRAATPDGRLVLGRAWLSADLPAPPRVSQPAAGGLIRPTSFLVSWQAVKGVAGYEVEVEPEDDDSDDGLRVRLPAERSSFRVPEGVLEPGTEASLEVAAIGPEGNRTVVEVRFRTRS